jgi:hypothetical protein
VKHVNGCLLRALSVGAEMMAEPADKLADEVETYHGAPRQSERAPSRNRSRIKAATRRGEA